jgi:hypothetical protein
LEDDDDGRSPIVVGRGPDNGHPQIDEHDPPLREDEPDLPLRVFPLLRLPQPPLVDPRFPTHWRLKAHHILENRWTHMLILVLVLADLAFVLGEIFIELFSFQACREHTFEKGGEHWEEGDRTIRATDALRIASLCVLSLFCVEITAKLLVLGVEYYTHHYIHLFDALVIVTSFVVTLVLHGPAEEVVALFVMLRLWRIVRVIDSVAVTVEQEHAKRRHKLHKRISTLEEHVKTLQEQVRELGASPVSPPSPHQLPVHSASVLAAENLSGDGSEQGITSSASLSGGDTQGKDLAVAEEGLHEGHNGPLAAKESGGHDEREQEKEDIDTLDKHA